ncbi:hemerythrin domain-containing protein [Rhodococcus marinonascens]|uniref:hemerythrin domain-containing protein n=1 Tax=Rhodococcus marinonascens TaxID=38311 RepID=UPI000934E9A0|nr:hemerythrin domain-containing protein [Rhodococcus marinonascens]
MTVETTADQLVEEFRATGGRISGPLSNARTLLLTTTDVRTGDSVTTPVSYLPDTGNRSLLGAFDLQSRAEVLVGPDRDEVFSRLIEADGPALANAQERFGAPLPVIALYPVSGRPAAGSGWGNDLRVIHDGFRRELALVRREVASAGPRLAAQLKINCLTMCGGLTHHHTMEGIQMLPIVAEKHPELAAVVERLSQEHEAMAALLDELKQLLEDENVDPTKILPKVERITRDVEAHLDYEEDQLIPVLNALVPGD